MRQDLVNKGKTLQIKKKSVYKLFNFKLYTESWGQFNETFTSVAAVSEFENKPTIVHYTCKVLLNLPLIEKKSYQELPQRHFRFPCLSLAV